MNCEFLSWDCSYGSQHDIVSTKLYTGSSCSYEEEEEDEEEEPYQSKSLFSIVVTVVVMV